MPEISVCIPTYNRKSYLKETLDSVFAQTFKDFEVVIVDDGSTDGTEEMVKSLGLPIRYCWQENSGDAAARNKLIELAEGKYISFIDSDDLLEADALERMVAAMEQAGTDSVAYGPYFGIDENGNIVKRCKRKLYSGKVTEYLFQDIFIHSCGSMFPRHIFQENQPFDTSLRVCSDYDLWLRLSLKYPFIGLEEPTFRRRRHSDNLSTASFDNRVAELNVLERFYYEKGGRKAVPEKAAMRRLAKEEYRAAKSAFGEGLFADAYEYSRRSFKRCPQVKTLVYLISSRIMKKVK